MLHMPKEKRDVALNVEIRETFFLKTFWYLRSQFLATPGFCCLLETYFRVSGNLFQAVEEQILFDIKNMYVTWEQNQI